MSVQWFPGHMHRARKQIATVMAKVDVVIEVLDARLPGYSENPLLRELRGGRPCLKVLNKSDLAGAGLEAELRGLGHECLTVSAKTGAGLEELCPRLRERLLGGRGDGSLVRSGRDRAELAARFVLTRVPALGNWLGEQALAGLVSVRWGVMAALLAHHFFFFLVLG